MVKSSLIFSSHNLEKLLLRLVDDTPQDIENLIARVDTEFNIHWWQKRSRERKSEYLQRRLKQQRKRKHIDLVENTKYLLTPKGKEILVRTEKRDQKISNVVKNLIKPSIAYVISVISIAILFVNNIYGFSISENPLFVINAIYLIIMGLNFYQILTASRNPIRKQLMKIIQISISLVGLGIIIFGLTILNKGITSLYVSSIGVIIIINIISALLSFLAIYSSGYLNENLDVRVLALNHRNTIFSPLFIVISIISMNVNLIYVSGVIVIVYGINILSEARRSNLGHFIHHILILLNGQPQTYEEILNLDSRLAMLFGAPMFFRENPDSTHLWINYHGVSFLQMEGLARKQKNLYYLTEKAIAKADKEARGMIRFFSSIKALTQPAISPLLSLVIHLILGSLKLIGFVLTGSVGLLGDGVDSAIDGISSIVVTIAMSIKRETEATYLLIILMAFSGLGILISSVTRLINPTPINEGDFGVLVAIISIIVCFSLYIYQKYSGYINRSLTILAQSEDSRNHVLNALLVLLAIAASELQIYLVDGIVGCFIGILVLRGAWEIFSDLRSYNQGENIDFGKYQLGIWKSYNRFQYRMLEKWVLYQIYQDLRTFDVIAKKFLYDFQPIIIKESQGEPYMVKFRHNEDDIKQALVTLEHKKLIAHSRERYLITDEGSDQIRKYRARYNHKW